MVVDGCLTGDCGKDLTSTEKEVLYLISSEFLTPRQIQIRRKCSQQAISKIICSLKKKGALTSTLKAVVKVQTTKQPTTESKQVKQIRLHGQEFNIEILFKDERYKKVQESESNTLLIDGNTIRLYKDSIEVYSGQHFYADDASKATAKSFEYWNRFFVRLEHQLNIIVVKSGCQNIKLVNHHYAEVNNELARDVNIKADRIKVYATDDGKLWFTIDNSFNLNEAEAVHSGSAKQDIEKVVGVFNDIRDNPHLKLSELSKHIASMIQIKEDTDRQLNELTYGVKAIADYLVSELPKKKEDPFQVRLTDRDSYFG